MGRFLFIRMKVNRRRRSYIWGASSQKEGNLVCQGFLYAPSLNQACLLKTKKARCFAPGFYSAEEEGNELTSYMSGFQYLIILNLLELHDLR